MTDFQKSTAELGGYVCPTCRLVFTAHVSQLGEEVKCPGCQHLVKIPREGEEEQKLRPRKSKKYVQAGNSEGTSASFMRNDRRKPDWERGIHQESTAKKEPGQQSLPWVWILPAGIIGLLLFGFMLTMVFNAKPVEPVVADVSAKPASDIVAPVEPAVAEKKTVEEYTIDKHGKLLEESITKFLQANTIEELLPLVRHTPGVEDRMKNYYSHHEMEKRDLRTLANSASLLDHPDQILFEARLSDYSTKQGTAQLIDGKIYIDWDTFVVYSDMPWNKLSTDKPTKAVMIRAVSNPSSYYNFDFTDDKWAAFELSSPAEDMTFIGYVPKNSALHAKLSPIGGNERLEVILKVKYPEEAISSNQIIIEDVVDTKWFIDTLEPQQ